MFVFSKGKPKKGQILTIPTKSAGRIDKKYRGQVKPNGEYVGKAIKKVKNEKLKTNIWIFSQNNGIDRTIKHNAQFPEQLVSDHIISWSNEDDLVYDPFMGSGTTAKVAILNKRNWIGSEISEDYCKMAEQRISELKN